MVAFCLFLKIVRLFVFLFLVVVGGFCLFFVPSWQRCPLLATSLSVVFYLLSPLFSERVSGLVWSGSVYLMTTAGSGAD